MIATIGIGTYTGGDMMFVAGQSTDTSAGTGGAVSLSTGIGHW